MPGLQAAIGANPYLYLVEEKIARREFGPADAMALIRYSDLTRMQTGAHPGPHVLIAATARTADFHIEGTGYAQRPIHSMFRSEQAAAMSVAMAMNTAAGHEAVRRLWRLHHVLGRRAVLHSRSAANPDSGVLRSNNDLGVWWVEAKTEFVTLVLDHGQTRADPGCHEPPPPDGHLVLVTAYPNLEAIGDPKAVPPVGADLLEIPRTKFAVFWHSK